MRNNYQATVPERVKTLAPRGLQFMDLGELRAYMDTKAFELASVRHLAERGYFGELFSELVLRTRNVDTSLLNQFGEALNLIEPAKSEPYTGSDYQNARIDSALANSGIAQGPRRHGEGSASLFAPEVSVPREIQNVPIAIIGYGAAGIMAVHALVQLGFRNITVYEKSKELGIWSHENVYGLSRNNPLNLHFFGSTLQAAPGRGLEVNSFLQRLVTHEPERAKVIGVKPGNLDHKIKFARGEAKSYPIVINAMGLGKPKAVSDPERMVAKTGQKFAGIRYASSRQTQSPIWRRLDKSSPTRC